MAIDATIKRLNDVLGTSWSTDAKTTVERVVTVVTDDNGTREIMNYFAFTELNLRATIDGTPKQAYGVGAMVNRDPDMAAKTALAEAIKKAGHQLGIALYLWDAETRAEIERKQKVGTSVAAMKREVMAIAEKKLGKKPDKAADVAKVFNVKVGDLTDADVLRKILEAEGVL